MNEITKIKLNNPVHNINNISSPNFKADDIPRQEKNTNNSVKYMIGATLLAGTIAIGIIGHKNNWWKKAAVQTDMTLDAFKGEGNRFEKGKAILSDGSFFTGKITKNEENGRRLILEYNNGVLNKSSRYEGENLLSSKEYKYNDKGFLSSIVPNQGREVNFIRDENTGKLIEFNRQRFYYSKDGKLKYMYNYELRNMHGNDVECIAEFDPVTKKPIKAMGIQDRAHNYYEFDENGKVKLEVYQGGLTDISKQTIYSESSPHEMYPNVQVLSMMDKDGRCRWTRGVNKDDNLWDEVIFGHYPNPLRIIRDKVTKTLDMQNDTNRIVIKDNIATISFNHNPCAKYNIETKRLEFLPENTHSREEIMNVYNEMTSQANLAKSKIRNAFKNTNKRIDFYNKTYDNGFRIKYPHIET